jgi:YVTN family beta-propeller protein
MSRNTVVRLLLLLVPAMAAIGFANSSFGAVPGNTTTMLYVENSDGDNVTVVNLRMRQVVGNIVVGQGVHGACGPTNGRTIFITVTSTRTLKIVDTAGNKVIGTIPLVAHPFGAQPNECASTPDGHYVAVPMRFYGKRQPAFGDLDIINMDQRRIVKVIPMHFPHNCFAADSNEVLYCESRAEGQIYRLNLKTMSFDEKFPIGPDPRPFAIAGKAGKIFSALGGFHGFAVLNTDNDEVHRVALPDAGPETPLCQRFERNTPTHGVALTPDGKELWVTSMTDGSVYVYYTATGTFSKPIHVGTCPNWITVTSNGEYVTVSNSDRNTVSIIDAKTEKVIANVNVGKVPKRLLVVNLPAR